MTDDIQLVIFDMDGVLVDVISSWAWVHNHFDVNNDDSLKAYKKGEIDNLEFIKSDIELWRAANKELSKKDLLDILKEVPLMHGFDEAIPVISEKYRTAIISGGLKPLAEYIGRDYFDRIMANDVKEENGRLTGEGILEVELKNKGEAMERLLGEMDVKAQNTAAIGNSHADAPMLDRAAKGIAFNPADERVRDAADTIIIEKDLKLLLDEL
ncbi:MAG: HAD-IB family phosphatase [Thermoplasmata archaeon]